MWIDARVLKNCHEGLFLWVWQPERPLVVIGNSNEGERECNLEACAKDGVEILKRSGGGGAVVLYPGCMILSLGMWLNDHFKNDVYFRKINTAIAKTLSAKWPSLSGIEQKGLSDLCIGDRKFAGTSLFRSRNYLLYQASLICDLDVGMIGRYLAHPSKEPDYRAGRTHKDFLVALSEVQTSVDIPSLQKLFETQLRKNLEEQLHGELIDPKPEQFKNLLSRASSS